jgi:serine/threonine-protein kinase RsbW
MNGTISKKAELSKRDKKASTYRGVATGYGVPMTIAHNQAGPCIELKRSLPSDVTAISPFVDKFIVLLRGCGCVPEGVSDVEIALREALANAIIHGNHEDPRKHVDVSCRCEPDEVSIAVKDEGQGFDINSMADPTAPENIGSVHGRGVYLMKTLMDEVRFEEGGAVVRMRKSAGQAAARDAQELLE